ncbi:MAG: phage baseplate assembly protein [Dichotomicrobium sp.]
MADSVVLILNGRAFDGWMSMSTSKSFEDATGEASVTMSPQPGDPLPARLGDTAQILLAGHPVITGHVHDVKGSHDDRSHKIDITIRDKTQDLIDSTIGPKMNFKSPIALKDVARQTLQRMGLSKIKVVDEIGPPLYRSGETVSGAIDETGFAFLERWARKRQVFLTTNGDGDLVITRNLNKRGPGELHKAFEDSPRNNVLSAEYHASDFERANANAVAAQKSPNDRDFWESKAKDYAPGQAGPMSKKWGRAFDTSVRPERRRYVRAGKAAVGKTPEETAKWHANIARARSVEYTADVQGFTMDPAGGQLWWPGFIITVFDAHFLLASSMFIKKVDFRKDWGGGAITTVTCVPPESYKPQSEASVAGGRTAQAGAGQAAPKSFPAADIDSTLGSL